METHEVAQSVPVAFTPGPWALGSRYGRSRTEVVSPDGHKALATVWTHRAETDPHKSRRDDVLDEEGAANLRLIAAAPDLHEALAVIVANAALIPDPATGESTDCYAVPIDDIEAALLALAKIRGAQ